MAKEYFGIHEVHQVYSDWSTDARFSFSYIPVYTSNIVHRNIFLFIPFSRYTPAARLAEVIYDSTLVTFTYDEASGTVKTIHLTHNGFISSIRYRQTGNACMGIHTHNLQQIQCAKAFLSSGYLAISTQRGTIRSVCSVMRPLNHGFLGFFFFFGVGGSNSVVCLQFSRAASFFFSLWQRRPQLEVRIGPSMLAWKRLWSTTAVNLRPPFGLWVCPLLLHSCLIKVNK